MDIVNLLCSSISQVEGDPQGAVKSAIDADPNMPLKRWLRIAGCAVKTRISRPWARLADGTSISIQAGSFMYSSPREDKGPYTAVEIGTTKHIAAFAQYTDTLNDEGELSVYGYVPCTLVEAYIASCGGIVGCK